MIVDLIWGLIIVLLMVVSSGIAVDGFEKLAKELKFNKLLLATLLVGFSTSLPELAIGIAAGVKGQPEVAFGNIVGANLANLSWIAGGTAILMGAIPVVGEYLRKDLWVTICLSLMPFVLMSDGNIGRVDGVILISTYFGYVKMIVGQKHNKLKHSKLVGRKQVKHHLKTVRDWFLNTTKIILALVALSVFAYILIGIALKLSNSLGVSAFWIGLLVIAFGTTLPELVLSIMAIERRDVSLLLGNILGSVVINSTLILGIIAVLSPIYDETSVNKAVSGIFMIIVLGLFWLLTGSKHKLERWEGTVLVGIYMMFVGLQLLIA